jgi:NAD(P)-dependent dehydrogenase (short-subunit alcohol dehydrogenase family)
VNADALAGRYRVLVTGATGIAAASARRLAECGAQLFIVARTDEQCRALADQLGSAAVGYAAVDLREEAGAEAAFAAGVEVLGGLDGVIAVAGGSGRRWGDGPLHEIPLAGWDETLRLNLTTTFLTAREAIRQFRRDGGGSLVLTSSVLAWSPSPRHFATHAYAATKAAICGLARTLAATYAADRIRVNAIAPGLVRTPMAERAAADPEILRFAERKQPLAGGMLVPGDVADAAVWALTSPRVTGQVIAVDGGWTVSEGA